MGKARSTTPASECRPATFGFGGGVDLPVGAGTSLLLGATYHHISNALGRENERNPSQNEAQSTAWGNGTGAATRGPSVPGCGKRSAMARTS